MKIKIKTESKATRCEICHKVDRFDDKTGKCARCENIGDLVLANEQQQRSDLIPIPAFLRENLMPGLLESQGNWFARLWQRMRNLFTVTSFTMPDNGNSIISLHIDNPRAHNNENYAWPRGLSQSQEMTTLNLSANP